LRRWLPEVEEPLSQLSLLEKDGRLLVRREEGQLAEPTGQGLLDFADESAAATVPVGAKPRTLEECVQAARSHEAAKRLEEAAKEYRQALLVDGPSPTVCFNLANVLFGQGQLLPAAERFRQVVEMEPGFAEAWNNLGNILAALGDYDGAITALERAVALSPAYADAHYNLADTLDEVGRASDAVAHWQAYLCYDTDSCWADYARQRVCAAGPAAR
jgi:tetratricopeptide (TPR) repeat protein